MKIKFMGAAKTVTGSCFILETGTHRLAIDCGLHQGNAAIEKRNWDIGIYEPSKIDCFLITHAHIDHSGLLPRMVQKGFQGRIYTTPPTRDLLEIMLLDSAIFRKWQRNGRVKSTSAMGRSISNLYIPKKMRRPPSRCSRSKPTMNLLNPTRAY